MKRLRVFAKGNLDVHDSLHSCRIGGDVVWNGINDITRRSHPGTTVRLKHETWARSDALLAVDGSVPAAVARHALPLDPYAADIQFSAAVFDASADVIVLSIQPDISFHLYRHRHTGFLFYPYNSAAWSAPDRGWLKTEFVPEGQLDVADSMANFERIIGRLRARTEAPILVYNVSSVVPGETVHCIQGMGETFASRARRFNLGLSDLSERTGISIIDVDTIVARGGADRLKLDFLHLTPAGYQLVAEEVVRVLDDLGMF